MFIKILLTIIFVILAMVPESNLGAQENNVVAPDERFLYNDAGKRDPFSPLLDADGNIVLYENELILSDLTVAGIMLSAKANESVVIINGRIFKINDQIGAFKVESILKDKIILRKGQETFDLKLKKE